METMAAPQKEHQWLHRMIGEWTSEAEAVMGPDKPPEKFRGTESVRSIGGLWTMGEGRGEMPGGGTSVMIMTLGYDPAKKRFVQALASSPRGVAIFTGLPSGACAAQSSTTRSGAPCVGWACRPPTATASMISTRWMPRRS